MDKTNKYGWILMIVVGLLLIVIAERGDTVSSEIITLAQTACTTNGGLDTIETNHVPVLGIDLRSEYRVSCKNGMAVTMSNLKLGK